MIQNDNELLYLALEHNENAINMLIEKYKPVIIKIIKELMTKYNVRGIDTSDLYQEGLLGLLNAIDYYDANKDILFYTYACVCIKSSIISELRRTFRIKNKLFNESYSIENITNNYTMLSEFFVTTDNDPDNILLKEENEKEIISKVKSLLNKNETEVFELKLYGLNNQEIASLIGKDKKSVENTLFRIKSKYKNKYLK